MHSSASPPKDRLKIELKDPSLYVESFYLLLWINNIGKEGEDDPQDHIKLWIPQTVIFKYGHPSLWYLNNKDGLIVRKKEASLTYDGIFKGFSRSKRKNKEVSATVYNFDESGKTVINYIDWETLEKICKEPDSQTKKDVIHPKFCVLQEHIQTQTIFNSVIECLWSKSFLILNKIRNRFPLTNDKYRMADRLMTFDAPDHCVQVEKVSSGELTNTIKENVSTIVNQFDKQTYQSICIDKMILYFKTSYHDRVYFLWPGEIQQKVLDKNAKRSFFKPSQVPLELQPIHQSSEIVTRFDSQMNVMRVHHLDALCPMCAKMVSPSHILNVPNSFIIKLYEDHREHFRFKLLKQPQPDTSAPFNTEKEIIPNYFRNLSKFLTLQSYYEMKDSEKFQKEESMICFDCYLLGASDKDKELLKVRNENHGEGIGGAKGDGSTGEMNGKSQSLSQGRKIKLPNYFLNPSLIQSKKNIREQKQLTSHTKHGSFTIKTNTESRIKIDPTYPLEANNMIDPKSEYHPFSSRDLLKLKFAPNPSKDTSSTEKRLIARRYKHSSPSTQTQDLKLSIEEHSRSVQQFAIASKYNLPRSCLPTTSVTNSRSRLLQPTTARAEVSTHQQSTHLSSTRGSFNPSLLSIVGGDITLAKGRDSLLVRPYKRQ